MSVGRRADLEPVTDTNTWASFHASFESLSKEETSVSLGNRQDLRITASSVGAMKEWSLSGGMNESFRARSEMLATQAAAKLGTPQGSKKLDYWLYRLYLDLEKNHSKLLFAPRGASEKAAMIVSVCEASAIFCARLEQDALEQPGIAVVAEPMAPEVHAQESPIHVSAPADSPSEPAIRQQQAAIKPFDWKDIDHSLANLKFTDLAEEFHKLIRSDEKRIQFENRLNLNNNAVPSLVLRMKEKRTDEWVQRAYDIYCDVWRTQGATKSAAFVRAVYARGLVPMIVSRTNAIASEFSMFAMRTGFSSGVGNAFLTSFRLKMGRLQDRWRRRLEAEAKECEHAERTKSLSTLAVSAPAQSAQPQLDSPRPSKSGPSDKTGREEVINLVQNPQANALSLETRREAVIKKVQNPQANTILTIPEAALYFEITAHTIYVWVSEGKLKKGPKRGSITIESILVWQKKRSRKRRRAL
jgi:hypothetical protein